VILRAKGTFRGFVAQAVLLGLAAVAFADEKVVLSDGLAPGEYDLTADTRSGKKPHKRGGLLVLAQFDAKSELAGDYRLFGWTEVDFKKLGAPIDAAATPAQSRDPDNPGVLLWVPPVGSEGLTASFKVHQPHPGRGKRFDLRRVLKGPGG
jgi:hypothetical protein